MSAGVIPIVYASGGQKEIVTDGVDGYLWDDIDQLTDRTLQLVSDSTLRGRLSQEATHSSKQFGRGRFAANVERLVAGLS